MCSWPQALNSSWPPCSSPLLAVGLCPLPSFGRRALRPPLLGTEPSSFLFFILTKLVFIVGCSLVTVVSRHCKPVCAVLLHKRHDRALQTVQVLNANEPVAISSALISPPYPSGPLHINTPSRSLMSASFISLIMFCVLLASGP